MKKKTCFKCQTTKPLTEYYKHPFMGDGHLGKCKDCTRNDASIRREQKLKDPQWVERERRRHRAKARQMVVRYPEKAAAHKAIRTMRKTPNIHLHHWSYLKEHHTDIIPLSAADHRKAHTMMVYDQEQMKYRRCSDMVLLDTREEHEQYLMQLGCALPKLESL